MKLGSFLSKVFWSKFRVFFSPNFLYFHTSHFFFQILQSIGMRNVPNIFAFFPKIGTRSVPNILPSVKFPNFVNVSCFLGEKKKDIFAGRRRLGATHPTHSKTKHMHSVGQYPGFLSEGRCY